MVTSNAQHNSNDGELHLDTEKVMKHETHA